MRVLMSVPDKRVRGGPPSHLYLLRDALRDLGVEVRTFVYGGRVHDESWARKILGRLLDLLYLPILVLKHRPDVIQLNSSFDKRAVLRDIFFVPMARLLGRTVITKFHGSDLVLATDRSVLWRVLTWIVVRGSHVVCLLSKDEVATFSKRFPRDRFALVKNALDLSRYQRTGEFCSKYGVPTDKPILLFLARFIEVKGLQDIIRALPAVLRQHDVHAVFAGDGPVRDQNERLCRELGVQGHTTFTGYIPEEETVDAYLSASMLVFPTYHQEGMPMVVFHSLASGLPIITTRIRAASDWLEENEHCLFVPPKEPDKLAEAVIHLLDRPELRDKMGRNGRELARKFEKTAVAEEFVEIYESLKRGGARSSERKRRCEPRARRPSMEDAPPS